MTHVPDTDLRTGFTTGACATAACKAAATALLSGQWPNPVEIVLPRGQQVAFPLADHASGDGWARATIQKDAGDDPDVTHGALVSATVRPGAAGSGVTFVAGPGVGRVTRPGLPIGVGEPAINPVPRQMMTEVIRDVAARFDVRPDFQIEVSIPGGDVLARQTWNPRLGIEGGLSILGTTGIVRPFSCAAWIASIHRGIDVARAGNLPHVVGATGATSEKVAQELFDLPDHAMLDMGDFAGGMLKYLAKHPVPRVTIAGGFGKLTKLAQGALDLHSKRSQVDFDRLGQMAAGLGADGGSVAAANTAAHALEIAGPGLARQVAEAARDTAQAVLKDAEIELGVLVIDRTGTVLARAGPA